MKIKKYAIIAELFFALLLSSCQKAEDIYSEDGKGCKFTVSAIEETKAIRQNDSEGSIYWSGKENFWLSTNQTQNPVQVTVDVPEPVATISFVADLPSVPSEQHPVWVTSAASSNLKDGVLNVSIKGAKEVADNFPAVAFSTSRNLQFRNICGGVSFTVANTGISSVDFSGNGGEPLAGNVKVKLNEKGNPVCEVVNDSDLCSSVSLNAPDAEKGFEVGKKYYIDLLPCALSKGFTMTFHKKDGTLAEYKTDKPNTVSRSKYGTLADLDKDLAFGNGEEDTISITPDKFDVEAAGGSIAVEVSSNVAVTMTIPENVSWITENKTKSVSTSTFHLDVAANETYETRSAEITFSNEESGLSEKVTVNQKGGDKENFVHFEDSPELEAYLIGEFDLDGDGRLSEEEASRVTSINLDNTDIEFTSLKGIEYFVNLQELRASGEYYMYDESVGYEQWQQREQKISGTVDLTKNTKLCHIWMRRHRITDLKLPKTQTITLIEIYDNLLTEINVSQCPRLNDLSISNNRLSNLDISENPEIMSLFASSNQLAEIDLSHNRKLSGLELAANQLTSIDLSANTNLSYLNLNYNNLSYLDVSKLSNLRSLYCADNHNLKYLVVSREQTIENIYPNRGDWQYIPESTEIIFDDEFRITPQSCEANYVGDVIEIEVISLNGSQISSVPDWVKLLGSAADGILNKFSFLVEANTSGTERSGHIVICDDGGECHSVAITQKNQAGHEVLDWREADFHHRSLVMWLASTAYGVCPPMAEAVEIVRNEHPDKIEVISMHEKKSTLYFYGVDLMLNRFRPNVIPIAMVDCRKEVNISDINTTANMIFGAAQETEENYKAVTGISFNSAINGNTLDVDVSVYAKVAEEFKIAVVLLEDGIVADQAGAEQGYIHYDVPRLNLSSSMEGDLFTVSQAGTVVPLHFSGTIPDNCVKRNCRVLVYIQRKFGSQRVVQTSGYGEWYVDNCVSGRVGGSVPLALGSDGTPYMGGNEDITTGDDINF